MKFAPIVPIPHLDLDLYPEPASTHLLLTQVLLGDFSKSYLHHYQALRNVGHYLILDNGADEAEDNRGGGVEETLRLATCVRAQEIVLPDVQYDGRETHKATVAALQYLRTTIGQDAYNKAGRPRVMVVPQGADEEEWKSVAYSLIHKAQIVMQELGGPTIVVGVAKQYEELCKDGLMGCCRWLHQQLSTAEDVHLLGWAHRLAAPVEIAETLPWVRSIDSAKPLVYALEGHAMSPKGSLPYPGRPDDAYFNLRMDPATVELAKTNIEMFRQAL